MAGVTPATASRSLKRLREAGWLRRAWKPDEPYVTAQRYRIESHRGTDSSAMRTELSVPLRDSGHETWVRLGKAAHVIWAALDGEPQSAGDIASRSYVGRTTAYRWLPRLMSYNLARRSGDGWLAGTASLDDVVAAEGWLGDNSKVFRRELEYIEDRTLYATYRERRSRRDAMQRQLRKPRALVHRRSMCLRTRELPGSASKGVLRSKHRCVVMSCWR
jgi:DNA-binding IclR family transcriptional regulator